MTTWLWRAAVALAGLLQVAALLGWVVGAGSFQAWFVVATLPAAAFLAMSAAALARHPQRDPRLRRALVAGTVGGIAGTAGYDVFRIPFVVVGGLRLLAPIDSYGVLLLGAHGSSATTGFAGWAYHFANGVGFGIAYAVVALGRRWPWAVVWAMVLETATILTPFADSYGLRGHADLIAIAYAAHLFYGIPLGLCVQRALRWDLRKPIPIPAVAVLGTVVVVLAAWLRPTGDVPARPAAVVVGGRFHPEWLRVEQDECATLANRDATSYRLSDGTTLPPHGTAQLCLSAEGAHRVRLTARPYSGGFILVDKR